MQVEEVFHMDQVDDVVTSGRAEAAVFECIPRSTLSTLTDRLSVAQRVKSAAITLLVNHEKHLDTLATRCHSTLAGAQEARVVQENVRSRLSKYQSTHPCTALPCLCVTTPMAYLKGVLHNYEEDLLAFEVEIEALLLQAPSIIQQDYQHEEALSSLLKTTAQVLDGINLKLRHQGLSEN